MIVPELVRQKIWNKKRLAVLAGLLSSLTLFGLFIITQQNGESGNLTELFKPFSDSNSPFAQEINSERLFGDDDVTGILSETGNTIEKFLISPSYETILKFQ